MGSKKVAFGKNNNNNNKKKKNPRRDFEVCYSLKLECSLKTQALKALLLGGIGKFMQWGLVKSVQVVGDIHTLTSVRGSLALLLFILHHIFLSQYATKIPK